MKTICWIWLKKTKFKINDPAIHTDFFCFDIMNVVDETLKHIILYLRILIARKSALK